MTIGIIGDGQLALMLAESLVKHSASFLCLGDPLHSPMGKAYPNHTLRDVDEFRERCDQFTLENEFLSVDALKDLLGEKSSSLFPDIDSYRMFANKISQRTLYQELDIPSPEWQAIQTMNDLETAKKNFSYPFILKTSSGGYDGKGVRVIRTNDDLDQALSAFRFSEGQDLLVEEMVSIKQELAQGFVQGSAGHFTLLPLVETVQMDGVCQYVYYPPQVENEVARQIEDILLRLIQKPLIGIFNFEFFVDQNNRVFINEGAPRPHNSQHLTIDASDYSQFDLVVHYLNRKENLPSKVQTLSSSMVNILGRSEGADYELILPKITEAVEVYPKLYLKETCSLGRKMGHVNIIDRTGSSDLRSISQKIFQEYKI